MRRILFPFFSFLLILNLTACSDLISSLMGKADFGISKSKPLGTAEKYNERLLADGLTDEGFKEAKAHKLNQFKAHVYKEQRIGRIFVFADKDGRILAFRARYNTEHPKAKLNMMINGFWHKFFKAVPELGVERPATANTPILYGTRLDHGTIAARWTEFYGLNDITFVLKEYADDFITY